MLDLTSLAYQPKLRELSTHPKRHVTFALLEQISAYPDHKRELDEDEDDKPLVGSDRTARSEDEDFEPLVQPTTRKERVEEKNVNLLQNAEFSHTYVEEKALQSGKTHLPHWSRMCQETRESDQKKSRFWAVGQTVKLSGKLRTSCLMRKFEGPSPETLPHV